MLFATGLALAAAVLHAGWNLLLKTAPAAERDITAWGFILTGGLLALPVTVALGGPGLVAAPWLALSACVHLLYLTALVAAYRHGDFSLAYPLARGGGALLAAAGGVALLGDRLEPAGWVAIGVVAGALASLVGRGAHRATVRDALLTAAAIGTYTLVDAHGSRVSADAAAYGFASTGATAVTFSALCLVRRRGAALVAAWPAARWTWVAGGAASAAAYAMVLVAVRHAPVGYVAVLRESSVVLGAAAGWLFLREPLGGRRLVSSAVVVAGLVGLVGASL